MVEASLEFTYRHGQRNSYESAVVWRAGRGNYLGIHIPVGRDQDEGTDTDPAFSARTWRRRERVATTRGAKAADDLD